MKTTSNSYWAVQVRDDLFVIARDPIRDGIVSVSSFGIHSLFDTYMDAERILEEIVKMKSSGKFEDWEPRITQTVCTLTTVETIHYSDFEITYKHAYQTKLRKMVIPRCPNPQVALLAFKSIMETRRRYRLGSIESIMSVN